MTKDDFVDGIQLLQDAKQDYQSNMQTAFAGYALPTTTTDTASIYPLILAEDWSGVKALSESRITELQTNIQGLTSLQAQANALFDQFFALKQGYKQHYPEPETQPDWADRKAAYEDEFANQNVPPDVVQKYIARLGGTGGLHAFNYDKRSYDLQVDILTFAFERNLAHFMYHVQSRATAQFNIAVGMPVSLPYNLSSKIYSLRSSIYGRNETIWNKLVSQNASQVLGRLTSFQNWLDSKLDQEIIPVMAASWQERAGPGATFVTDGKRVMGAGELFREAMFAQATILWLRWVVEWSQGLKLPDNTFAAAAELTFDEVSLGDNSVSVADLVQQGPNHDNAKVVVSGEIANLEITHVGPAKAKSTAEVTDSQGRAIRLVLPYIKLDSGGLVDGCYAELAGRFMTSNPEASGGPAISIDRLGMEDMAETSWPAWLRHMLRDVYQPVAHNLGVSFSCEPRANGLANQVKYDTTYVTPKLPSLSMEI